MFVCVLNKELIKSIISHISLYNWRVFLFIYTINNEGNVTTPLAPDFYNVPKNYRFGPILDL